MTNFELDVCSGDEKKKVELDHLFFEIFPFFIYYRAIKLKHPCALEI